MSEPKLSASITLVPYINQYAHAVGQIYHDAVRGIAHPRYTDEQLRAWSLKPRSNKHWHYRLSRSQAWLALSKPLSSQSGKPPVCVGFINIETRFSSRGYIDSLYIAPQYQGQGIATALYQLVENFALEQGIETLSVDASYLSKSLFEQQGFVLQQRSYQSKCGQFIPGFYLTKALRP